MNRKLGFHPFAFINLIGVSVACYAASALAQNLPLEILSQPQSVSVGVGNDAQFAVQANGTAPIYYQWQSRGMDLPGETRSTLLLTNVQLDQAGCFSVIVSNASGSLLSSPARLEVSQVVIWRGDTNLPMALGAVRSISGGGDFTLALRVDGTVIGWGHNESGQANPPSELTNVVAISGGSRKVTMSAN
jgi:hypothetical protein